MLKRIFIFSVFMLLQALQAQVLTVREVYDLHIGDELGIRIDRGPRELKWMKVIDRKELGHDSLRLTYYVRNLELRYNGAIFSEDTFILSLGNLDSPYFKNYVEKSLILFDSLQGNLFSVRRMIDSTFAGICGTLVNWRYYSFSGEALYEEKAIFAYKGLGSFYQRYTDHGGPYAQSYDEQYLEYYLKDGDTCGNTKDFPLSFRVIENAKAIKVFPNPATQFITISGMTTFAYQIINQQGKELLCGMGAEQLPIDLSHVTPGLYIINLSDGTRYASFKLAVN